MKYPASNCSLVPYLKYFGTSQLEFGTAELHYISCNLPKNNVHLTPWLVQLYRKKGLWFYFSQLFQTRIHLNIEINKLDWLKQFNRLAPLSFYILIYLTDNKWCDTPWDWYLTISASLVFTKFAILFCFRTSFFFFFFTIS